VAVATNAVTLAIFFSKSSVPAPYHVMFTFPKLALVNVMGCKVFRDIKLGKVSPTVDDVDCSTIRHVDSTVYMEDLYGTNTDAEQLAIRSQRAIHQ
jgi:hypothetical protein